MKRKIQTTLHIFEATRERLKKIAKTDKLTMSGVIDKRVNEWANEAAEDPRRDRAAMDEAASILIEAVCEELRTRDWAINALINAGMGLPGATVYDRRIGHYVAEKQELGSRLAHWVLRRSVGLLEQGTPVVLVCDSGTTVFWFLKAFGEAISDYFARHKNARVDLTRLTIVTNSLPGAESFVTYASHHTINTSSGVRLISDLVRCRLLAGTLLPEYVAVTGDDTERDLEHAWQQARSAPAGGGTFTDGRRVDAQPARAPVFIGVTTGNWVTIEKYQGHKLPHLLARGTGHGPFKFRLLDLCDEVFVLAPLGKVLLRPDDDVRPVDKLNEMLGYQTVTDNPHQRTYDLVAMPSTSSTVDKIKLVSTLRQKSGSIFLAHSVLVREALGDYASLDPDDEATMADTSSLPIDQVQHLLFPFDAYADLPIDEQVERELPHPSTRTPAFKREFVSIRT